MMVPVLASRLIRWRPMNPDPPKTVATRYRKDIDFSKPEIAAPLSTRGRLRSAYIETAGPGPVSQCPAASSQSGAPPGAPRGAPAHERLRRDRSRDCKKGFDRALIGQ